MVEKNYKLLYDIQPYRDAIREAETAKRKADLKVAEAEKNFREACAKLTNIQLDDLHFSNVSCMARGVLFHVYHIKRKYAQYGSPENKCIFCGCDNVDEFY